MCAGLGRPETRRFRLMRGLCARPSSVGNGSLEKIQRYETYLSRQFNKVSHELQGLQALRVALHSADPDVVWIKPPRI